jgi:bacterioferritin-associated ferredoxin
MKAVTVSIDNQDSITAEFKDGCLHFSGEGCLELLEMCKALNAKKIVDAVTLDLPKGSGHVAMLFRELIEKLKEVWNYPYSEAELCHCRAISTKVVDDAILNGLHKVEEIGRYCSAGVTCGNCRTDIENIIKYRKG